MPNEIQNLSAQWSAVPALCAFAFSTYFSLSLCTLEVLQRRASIVRNFLGYFDQKRFKIKKVLGFLLAQPRHASPVNSNGPFSEFWVYGKSRRYISVLFVLAEIVPLDKCYDPHFLIHHETMPLLLIIG